MRPLGGGSPVTSPEDKLLHVNREMELLHHLAVRRPLYSSLPTTSHGPQHPPYPEMLTYGVVSKHHPEDQILFELTPASGPTSGPDDAFDPRRGGLLVRCTIGGASRLFVHQYGSQLTQTSKPSVLNTKVGALSLLTSEGAEGTLLEGCSYTLDGSSIKSSLLREGESRYNVLLRTLKGILREEGVSGWTFYTHEFTAKYATLFWGVITELHNGTNNWFVSPQHNKSQALCGFEVTSRTNKQFKVTFTDSHLI